MTSALSYYEEGDTQQKMLAHWADRLSGMEIAEGVAEQCSASLQDTWDAMSTIPDAILIVLLKSPYGWRTIASHAATILTGVMPTQPWSPTVH